MQTHWKKLTNPNYLGAYSIENGQDLVLTIRNVREEKVIGADGKKDDCVVCYFYENVKPMILNSTNMKTIQKLYKTPYIENWVGKQIQIGVEQVRAFGDIVDALRVRNFLPRQYDQPEQKILCEACEKELTASNGLSVVQLAAYTRNKYNRCLCAECAKKAAQAKKDGEPHADQ